MKGTEGIERQKRKLLTLGLALTISLLCVPATGGGAFAGEADSAGIKAEKITAGEVAHKCGYTPVQGIPKGTAQPDSILAESETEDTPKAGRAESSLRALYSTGTAESSGQDSDAGETTVDEVKRYGYNYLTQEASEGSEESKKNNGRILALYESIRKGIAELQNEIDTTITSEDRTTEYPMLEEVETAFSLVKDDYPEYFWVGGYFYYTHLNEEYPEVDILSLEPMYLFSDSEEEFTEVNEEFNAGVNKILAEMEAALGESASDYDKELWLHDYLIETNDYLSYSEGVHTAYGAIVEGEAVCEGYTRAFQLLLNKLGIENCTITGSDDPSSTIENHIWNAVKLDGSWYQVDVTWDDAGNDSMGTYHAYFNITTEAIKRDHSIINSCKIPECTSTKDFYFNRTENAGNTFTAESADTDEENFASNVAAQITSDGFAAIYCPEDIGDISTLGDLFIKEDGLAALVATKLNLENYTYGYNYAGNKEYHFTVQSGAASVERANFYGQLVLGIPDLDGVRIRLYASDDKLIATDDTGSDIIWDAIKEHRKDDNLHLATAEKSVIDPDADWWNVDDKGCKFTHFEFSNIPVGEYNLAVYKEDYGLWIYGITIGEDGKIEEEQENDNCWWCIYTLGDLDDNTWVDSSDALFMQRYIAKWERYVETGNWYAADINNDGNIDIRDLTILQRHLAGWSGYENLEDYESGDKELENTENAA